MKNWNKETPSLFMQIARGMKISNGLDNYLELGTFRGRTFNKVAPFANNAYAVDMNIRMKKYIAHNKNLIFFHCSTDEFFSQLKDDVKFDLIFIDACHLYENSMRDFENSFKHIKDNGIIILHDTYPPNENYISEKINRNCGDSYKTALEIKKNWLDVCEISTLPFWFGISIVRKIPKDIQVYWKGV